MLSMSWMSYKMQFKWVIITIRLKIFLSIIWEMLSNLRNFSEKSMELLKTSSYFKVEIMLRLHEIPLIISYALVFELGLYGSTWEKHPWWLFRKSFVHLNLFLNCNQLFDIWWTKSSKFSLLKKLPSFFD